MDGARRAGREYQRAQSVRLPTPPPPPPPPPPEPEFLDYLNSLERPGLQRAGSLFAPAVAAEDAFDHLDKLYKLMEQLLNLREQNAKLQRRVRDLERLSNLQAMHQHVTSSVLRGREPVIPEPDEDEALAELLESVFASRVSKRPTKRKSLPRVQLVQPASEPPTANKSPAKVSKWTKVKAAFRWEKASPTVSGAKSQDSGIGGMAPVNHEVARYLRVPSASDHADSGPSPADSVMTGSWTGGPSLSTPGTLSSASSTDDLMANNSEHRCVSRSESGGNPLVIGTKRNETTPNSDDEDADHISRTLEFGGSELGESSLQLSKEELLKLQANKSHKTPWGKVKDIIQTRKDSLKKKNRLSARSDELKMDWSAGSDQEDVFEGCDDIKTPTVTITATTDLPAHQPVHMVKITTTLCADEVDLKNISPTVLARYQQATAEENKHQVKETIDSPRTQRRISKWTKVKKAFLTSTHKSEYESQSVPTSPTKQLHFFPDLPSLSGSRDEPFNKPRRKISQDEAESRRLKEEIYKNYEQLQRKLTQEFQEKLQEWEKVKLTNCSVSQQASSSAVNVEDRDPEFVRKMEEWERIKNMPDNKKRSLQMTSGENLPADFKKKLQEWQKIKKFGKEDPNIAKKKITDWQLWRSNSTQKQDSAMYLSQPDGRQLSEDFIKKLDEWKQIKASQFGEDSERRKSLKDNKTPSPSSTRIDTTERIIRQSKKYKVQEEKELQWLEKELQKIEKEKQRLEREREKFLEREERLAKLRKSLDNDTQKKDVLVQTSTGFFRFEGISRKFTQKLYEWEKARGISPEDSTLVLLNPGFKPVSAVYSDRETVGIQKRHDKIPGVKLIRSKSVDSVANMTVESLITHQPSSLSLNDMEELEMHCLANTRPSSEPDLNESEDNLDDFAEPEAVIVEIEDLEEETAAPLESCIQQSQYTPIYQTEAPKLCESEKCEAPQVRRSESARTMSSYNLIQDSLNILSSIKITEETCRKHKSRIDHHNSIRKEEDSESKPNEMRKTGAIPKRTIASTDPQLDQSDQSSQDELRSAYSQQANAGRRLFNTCLLLQDANNQVTKNASQEEDDTHSLQTTDTIELVQDLTGEIVSMCEQLKFLLFERNQFFFSSNKDILESNKKHNMDISEAVDTLTVKLTELKRSVTYLCAASDLTAPGKRKRSQKGKKPNKSASVDQATVRDKLNSSDENEDMSYTRKDKWTKSYSEDCSTSFSKLQASLSSTKLNTDKNMQKQPEEESNREDDSNLSITIDNTRKSRGQRKLLRTRRISDSYVGYGEEEDKPDIAPMMRHDVIIQTNSQFVDAVSNNGIIHPMPSSPVSVFVHTTRKIFTTFASESYGEEYCDAIKESVEHPKEEAETEDSVKKDSVCSSGSECQKEFRLPPLPASPVTQRRERLPKETSPAIRLMIARYNQKLSEQGHPGDRSGGSSGSASPVAWRSPVLERRVRAQTERYQEELNKTLDVHRCSPLLQRKQVKKSASAGLIQPLVPRPPPTVERGISLDQSSNRSPRALRGILKSTSTDCFVQDQSDVTPKLSPSVQLDVCPILQERASRLQRAKEEFMLQGTSGSAHPRENAGEPKHVRNRLSQVSFGSESSCEDACSGLLVKSASAGMINVDEQTYEQVQPEVHGPGYVSLPRQTKKKDGKFGISSIASKFRKVKMRRTKEPTQMNTISTLCRQSLLVDITGERIENQGGNEQTVGLRSNKNSQSTIASADTPTSSKTSWIKNPSKIFKQK